MMKYKAFSLLLILLIYSVDGYPSGPPAEGFFKLVCEQLTPSPEAHGVSQKGHGGYLVKIEPAMTVGGGGFVYKPNQAYKIKLVGTMHTFKGFLMEARNPSAPPPSTPLMIGQFSGLKDGSKTLNCDPAGVATEAAVGHSNPSIRSSVQFTWTAPSTKGSVDFYYTVVQETKIHFDQLSAAKLASCSAGKVGTCSLETAKMMHTKTESLNNGYAKSEAEELLSNLLAQEYRYHRPYETYGYDFKNKDMAQNYRRPYQVKKQLAAANKKVSYAGFNQKLMRLIQSQLVAASEEQGDNTEEAQAQAPYGYRGYGKEDEEAKVTKDKAIDLKSLMNTLLSQLAAAILEK